MRQPAGDPGRRRAPRRDRAPRRRRRAAGDEADVLRLRGLPPRHQRVPVGERPGAPADPDRCAPGARQPAGHPLGGAAGRVRVPRPHAVVHGAVAPAQARQGRQRRRRHAVPARRRARRRQHLVRARLPGARAAHAVLQGGGVPAQPREPRLVRIGPAGRARGGARVRGRLSVGVRGLSRRRRARASLRPDVPRVRRGLPPLRRRARPRDRRAGAARPPRAHAHRAHLGPRAVDDPDPLRDRRVRRARLPQDAVVSQDLAVALRRRGRGHGVGQRHGERLPQRRARLARAAGSREGRAAGPPSWWRGCSRSRRSIT